MGAQFEQITFSSEISLTLIVDDIARQRRDALRVVSSQEPMDLVSWINALQRQSAPMVHSRAAREHLEVWLEEVQQHIEADEAPAALPAP